MINSMIKLNTHPYPAKVWFTTDKTKFSKKRKELTGRTDDVTDSRGVCSSDDNHGNMVIGLFDVNSSTLVHELSHATINILEYVGIPITHQTSEAFCYLLGSLHEQCNNYLNKTYK